MAEYPVMFTSPFTYVRMEQTSEAMTCTQNHWWGGGGWLELRTAAIMYSNNMSCCLLCRAFQISQLWGFTVLLDGHFWPLHSRLTSFAWESCILKMWRSSLKLQLLKSMILYLAFYFHSTDPWMSAAHVGRSKSTRFQNRSKDFAFVKWICSCV